VLEEPLADATVDGGTAFVWSVVNDQVTQLELWPGTPTQSSPAISIFTASSRATWPDLAALDVSPPKAGAYTVRVIGFGRYSSIGHALGPDGIGAIIPIESRRSSAPAIEVTLEP
jgi:hypothetical protein